MEKSLPKKGPRRDPLGPRGRSAGKGAASRGNPEFQEIAEISQENKYFNGILDNFPRKRAPRRGSADAH